MRRTSWPQIPCFRGCILLNGCLECNTAHSHFTIWALHLLYFMWHSIYREEYPDCKRMGGGSVRRRQWGIHCAPSPKSHRKSQEDCSLPELTLTVYTEDDLSSLHTQGIQLPCSPTSGWKEECAAPIPKASLKEPSPSINQLLPQGPHRHLQHFCSK